jgi:fucose permease
MEVVAHERRADARAGRLLLALAFLAFVSLGLPDTIFGVAWPDLRRAFDAPQAAAGALLFAAGSGYLLSSLFAGRLARASGVGALLALSALALTAACLGYAVAPAFPWLVALSAVAGLGSGAIDAALNAHASTHFSPRHVNWLHACYSLGATVGPLIMTAMVVRGSWRTGYAVVGGVMLVLTALFAATHRRWELSTPDPATRDAAVGTLAALRHPLVLTQVFVFFAYTGLEMTVGTWCYTLLTEARGHEPALAGAAASLYFGAIGAGRVGFGLIANRVDLDRLLRMCTAFAVAGALLFAFSSSGAWNLAGLAVLGLALAPVYPCLMSRTPRRLGPDLAAHAFGFQVCAATFGAILAPALGGLLAQRAGLASLSPLVTALAAALLVGHEALLRRTRPAAAG